MGYKGKECQEMEFCQLQDCPAGSECRNLNHGYECVSNITIHRPDPVSNSCIVLMLEFYIAGKV